MTTYRDFILKWSPAGSSSNINITSAENTQIGAFKQMRVKSITVPITFYAISSINNTFLLKETGVTWKLITIPASNYTSTEFAAAIKTVIEASDVLATTYTVTISSTTGKLTITASTGTISIAFPTNDVQREKIWGVPHGTAGCTYAQLIGVSTPTAAQINNTPAITYVSTNPVMLWGPDYLLLKSSTLVKMLNNRHTVIIDTASTGVSGIDASGNAVSHSSIISRIPITVTPFSQQLYTEFDNSMLTVNQQMTPTVINLDITDESNNSINFNGGWVVLVMSVS